jgi:hypothetical protein
MGLIREGSTWNPAKIELLPEDCRLPSSGEAHVLWCCRQSEGGMSAVRIDDPVLSRFRLELGEAYGSRLERVVLFGSRARGDARPDSDYDIAVFMAEVRRDGVDL